MQESMAGLVNGLVPSHARATQQIFRLTAPEAMFDLQRRFVRDYLDAAAEGTGAFIRLARQTAEQTLRPLEERIEERQQNRDHQQSGAQKRANERNGDHAVVADVMSSKVRLAALDDTIQQATRLMRDEDTGVLPVGEGDRLVGIITDRDVTMRLVAEGKDPARTKVREVMTQEVKYVFEDEDLGHVADTMAEQQARRLPVINREKRVVGVISMGDLSRGPQSGRYAERARQGVAPETARKMPSAAE
jgi:CBS domain-containing protein